MRSTRRRVAMLSGHVVAGGGDTETATVVTSPGLFNMPDQHQSQEFKDRTSAKKHFRGHAAAPPEGRPFLSADADFGNVSRGDPTPHALDAAALAEAGLTEETWSLSVAADPFVDPPHVKLPATIATPLKLNLPELKALGEQHGTVKLVKAMQCLNVDSPLGQGLWEGVSLATVLRACGRMANIRRVNYWGYHNDDPGQQFRSSVSYTEAMEPAAGEPPVMLCWALNGEPLSLERGGPVRMVVPHAHGFKSVKWLQHITLTNDYRTADTYATIDDIGNDPASHLKTYAYIEGSDNTEPNREAPGGLQHDFVEGETVRLSGVAMSGRTPLERVEYWARTVPSHDDAAPLDDDAPELLGAPWQPATLQPPPSDWAAALPDGTEPAEIFGFGADGQPRRWPLPMSYVGWSADLAGLAPGCYELRARTVDEAGNAQPQPRPVQKTGRNGIGCRRITVAAA